MYSLSPYLLSFISYHVIYITSHIIFLLYTYRTYHNLTAFIGLQYFVTHLLIRWDYSSLSQPLGNRRLYNHAPNSDLK